MLQQSKTFARVVGRMRLERTSVARLGERCVLLPACPATTTILMRSLLLLLSVIPTIPTHSRSRPLQRPLLLSLRRRRGTAGLTHARAADDEHDVAARPRPG